MEQPKQKIVTGFGLFKSVNTLVATPKNLDDLAKCIEQSICFYYETI